MPKIFSFGEYVLFFWVGENGEPVHIHVSVKRPEKNSTKIWLTKSGGGLLANNDSHISPKDLRNIMEFITYNHNYICMRWKEIFGEISFYE